MIKAYLGNSVYAEYDGLGIILTTENGDPLGPSSTIYMEPEVLAALIRYRDDLTTHEREK